MQENVDFLTTQIITYLGNKRSLLHVIEQEIETIKQELHKDKLVCADLFSGSGIVARMMKQHASHIIVNDLEHYSAVINQCYLTNKSEYPRELCATLRSEIQQQCATEKTAGVITKNYAPKNDCDIQKGERVFYTHENALLIDTYRMLIEEKVSDTKLRPFFLAPLITQASVHVNTSGVFKGFYKDKNTGIGCFGASGKNALSRITGSITLPEPVLSNFECSTEIHQQDAEVLAAQLQNIDVTYLDPPYNQHPYGSNYFMLNLILKNKLDTAVSKVSGITQDWNRSQFNKSYAALISLENTIAALNTKYVVVSYNSEGFISFSQMENMLARYGTIKTVKVPYNTFRGSRNLNNRNIHVCEYLFVLKRK